MGQPVKRHEEMTFEEVLQSNITTQVRLRHINLVRSRWNVEPMTELDLLDEDLISAPTARTR